MAQNYGDGVVDDDDDDEAILRSCYYHHTLNWMSDVVSYHILCVEKDKNSGWEWIVSSELV